MNVKPTKPEDYVRLAKTTLGYYRLEVFIDRWELCPGLMAQVLAKVHETLVCDVIRTAVNANATRLMEFIDPVACESHAELCPLNHPAYNVNWCSACEAEKLLKAERAAASPTE